MNAGNLQVQAPELTSATPPDRLEEMDREHIMGVLERSGWRAGENLGAAKVLGMNRSTHFSKMEKLSIHRPISPATMAAATVR